MDFSEGTKYKRGILSRFSDKRPNRSHLRGAPKTKMAYGPARPKSVPATNYNKNWTYRALLAWKQA